MLEIECNELLCYRQQSYNYEQVRARGSVDQAPLSKPMTQAQVRYVCLHYSVSLSIPLWIISLLYIFHRNLAKRKDCIEHTLLHGVADVKLIHSNHWLPQGFSLGITSHAIQVFK